LVHCPPTWNNSEVIFDVDNKNKIIAELSSQMSSPGFWNDESASTATVKKLKILKNTVESWEAAFKKYQELNELSVIVKESDKDLIVELDRDTNFLLTEVDKFEFQTLLSGDFDRNNAILSINAGAGGTESCDWVSMLLRMYTRFAEYRGYVVKTIDLLYGEEAGIKNVTILIEGGYAFGYLKSERGVHRLVRISPFDANKRRHTSFASVDVIPEVEDNTDIKIEDKDLNVETFRASGPGGQHMQKTDSAVRITHIPSGIVVAMQEDRSQHRNRAKAMAVLRSKLYDHEQQKINSARAAQRRGQIGSGDRSERIRTYNFPQGRVSDHRINLTLYKLPQIIEGEALNEIIDALVTEHQAALLAAEAS
jgi:peptide chain release factor 2